MYVESAFLKRWWDEQNSDMRRNVRTLLAEGRLEIINGGWCMHDEAAPYYTDMIDQTTLGRTFLSQTNLGFRVKGLGFKCL